MAINLNPGADATLVSAAYRAAVNTAPKDYSRTLQRAADSYEKTMQAQSQTFGTIAKLGASIGVEMMANAQKNIDQLAKGDTLNPEDTEFFVNKLQTVKNELSELGPLKGMFGNKQTRIDRAKLKAKQKGIFASIDQALLNIKTGNEIVASGAFDDTLLDEKLDEKETINAIIKSNQKNKFTKNGNEAKLSENENGDLMYTLYNNNGGLSVNPNGSNEPVTMTLEKFNELIANNVKDGGAMKGTLDKITDATYKSGITSLSGTYDPEMKQMHLNALDGIINNETDLRRGMGTKFGYSNSSFLEDIKKPSNLSMWVYNDLLAATGAEGGVLAEGGILEGVKDIDGKPGISQKDLQDADNYGVLAANIIGMKDQDVSKALFKEYTIDKFEATHKYGYGKKAPTAVNSPKVVTSRNRTESFQLFTGLDDEGNRKFANQKTSTNELISLDNQLSELQSLNKSSFTDENYVDLFGEKVGYFPGKGFAPIRIRDDGQLVREQIVATKMPKGGYWKTPSDVFKNYSIPTFNQKDYDIIKNGKKYKKVEGGYIEIK
tara:strand:- start:24 stop:1667 length:1644 start_codon:yes stop_codon:yes gene_type:complete